ncbi:hypothetical protein ACM25O_13185 [Sulfitobacter pontiacus]
MNEEEIGKWSDRFNRHKGLAAVFGGFMSMTVGATWWLAKGGAVTFLASVSALSNPNVAATLAELPQYQDRVEMALLELQESNAHLKDALLQVSDSLEGLRAVSEEVVEWAPSHSQQLTDAVGGCYAGQQDCVIYLRGRRTAEGEGCELDYIKPRLLLPDGRDFPVDFDWGYGGPPQLTTRWDTIRASFGVPAFVLPGEVGVVVLTVYSECPFAGKGRTVERETFRLVVQIRAKG